MLDPDPNQRLSAAEALEHEFFNTEEVIQRRRKASQELINHNAESDEESEDEDLQIINKQQSPTKQEILYGRNRANSSH